MLPLSMWVLKKATECSIPTLVRIPQLCSAGWSIFMPVMHVQISKPHPSIIQTPMLCNPKAVPLYHVRLEIGYRGDVGDVICRIYIGCFVRWPHTSRISRLCMAGEYQNHDHGLYLRNLKASVEFVLVWNPRSNGSSTSCHTTDSSGRVMWLYLCIGVACRNDGFFYRPHKLCYLYERIHISHCHSQLYPYSPVLAFTNASLAVTSWVYVRSGIRRHTSRCDVCVTTFW